MITGNTAIYGGGIWCSDGLSTVKGNVITKNSASDDGGGIYYTSAAYVSCSDVEGGWSGTGNIDEPPLFSDPVQNDYTLSSGSPCIDRGDPSSAVPRGGACVCDMGRFEFYQGIDCHRDPVESWTGR